jgi:CRISPR-associated protein Csb2
MIGSKLGQKFHGAESPAWALPRIQAVLLGLDATVLPLVTATVEVAEQIRIRLMGAHKRRVGEEHVSPLFSGKTGNGEKRLDHGHLYILPLASGDGRPERMGRIDRVLLVSRLRPFFADELDAVRGVTELWQGDSRPTVRCVLTWQGKGDEENIWRRSMVATSATPFVTARHWRPGRDFERFIKDEVIRECLNHSLSAPAEVELMNEAIGPFHCIEFRRNRKQDAARPGYVFRLHFEQPVLTPFSIGYGAHFGLGQFAAGT